MTASSSHNANLLRFSSRNEMCTLHRGGYHATKVIDSYRDAPAHELHGIIADVASGTPWREAVARVYAEKNPWLFKIVTDPSRDLFFRLHPPPPGAGILDVGAGWGQIALPLARQGFVCALEPTPERLQFIHAAATQEGLAERMWFVQADFFDVAFEDRFDLVTCIGVLEWVPKFAPHLEAIEAQLQFLRKIRTVLAPGGRLVVGIENRLGLKYLLGAPDDHTGESFLHVFDRELAACKWRLRKGTAIPILLHSLDEYRRLFRDSGFTVSGAFAALPDYKLPITIIDLADSDAIGRHVASSGREPEHDGHTGRNLPFEAELASCYKSIAPTGAVHHFVPSFFFALT